MLRAFALVVAVTIGILTATPALASRNDDSPKFVVAITSEGPSVNSLFDGNKLAATSVSMGNPLTLRRHDQDEDGDSQGDLLGLLLPKHGPKAADDDQDGKGGKKGPKFGLLGDGGQGLPILAGGPSAPIPEGRTLLLYAAGFSLVGWALLRLGHRSH